MFHRHGATLGFRTRLRFCNMPINIRLMKSIIINIIIIRRRRRRRRTSDDAYNM